MANVFIDPRPSAVNFPARCALIQFDSVCSITPNDRSASAILRPDSTSRTASILNSYVYTILGKRPS